MLIQFLKSIKKQCLALQQYQMRNEPANKNTHALNLFLSFWFFDKCFFKMQWSIYR